MSIKEDILSHLPAKQAKELEAEMAIQKEVIHAEVHEWVKGGCK